MPERIRLLLDEAAADVRPRTGDPSGAVVRRARSRRRRAVSAAAAVATLAIVSAVAVANVALRPDSVAPAATPSPRTSELREPLHPEVDGSAVRFSGLVLPLTDGWKFRHFELLAKYCDIPAKTVVVADRGINPGDCDAHAQVEVGQGGLMGRVPAALYEVVLPGGQPLWLDDNELNNFTVGAKRSFFAAGFDAPWAAASVSLEMPTPMARSYLEGIRSEPVPPARLSIPDAPKTVSLTVNGSLATSSNPATIQQVIQRLQHLNRTVDPAQPICPGGRPLGPWALAAQDMADLVFAAVDYKGHPLTLGRVAMGASTGCAFATSSSGGRVWLPEGFAAQLHELIRTGA